MNNPVQKECWAIIPATGIGSRMQADRPKQYLEILGKSILEHTLDNLLSFSAISGAVLVVNANDDYWPRLQYYSDKTILTCHGGKERHHSVFNGLHHLRQHTASDCIVMIHDAVRPLVSHQDLARLLDITLKTPDGALLGTKLADTIKQVDAQNRVETTRDRSGLWRAYTPQAFSLETIHQALSHVIEKGLSVTDDASAMEIMGFQPVMVDSDSRNIKITHPQDLLLAELLLKGTSKN